MELEITTTKDDGRFFAEAWIPGNDMPEFSSSLHEFKEDALNEVSDWMDDNGHAEA